MRSKVLSAFILSLLASNVSLAQNKLNAVDLLALGYALSDQARKCRGIAAPSMLDAIENQATGLITKIERIIAARDPQRASAYFKVAQQKATEATAVAVKNNELDAESSPPIQGGRSGPIVNNSRKKVEFCEQMLPQFPLALGHFTLAADLLPLNEWTFPPL